MLTIDPSRVYRTPDSAFQDLPGFPYVPRYEYYHGLRYALIDETSPYVFHDGRQIPIEQFQGAGKEVHWETYLCFHGQPTWSYLYRKMIPVFLNRAPPKGSSSARKYVRRRVLAPDYIGFGRSDKPIDDEVYKWHLHHDFLIQFIIRQVLGEAPSSQGGDVIGVMQDWGGILGLTLPAIFPTLFTHLLVMNTSLCIGLPPSKGWLQFRDFIARSPDVNVGPVIGRGSKHLSKEEVAAYDAPHPIKESKAGVRRFPPLVPIRSGMAGVASGYAAKAYFNHLPRSSIRPFVAIGVADPVLGIPVMEDLISQNFASTLGCFIMNIQEAGHFVQEWGGPIAEKAIDTWAWAKDGEEGEATKRVEGVEWREPKTNLQAEVEKTKSKL
ncbi:alpha/beta-hydrolase [Sistotremastrum niveocremeum HHB9708]|uniref:Alpha/beta-hydrolase n=1 Tax=Sistotremastrum niveocremeum HHB9708 TaxID=1314777 RepID=A0A164QI64_9AGAM|nr:alpha/beta-hydrolase [Sistotremastrum niveocremeum HHB9708]